MTARDINNVIYIYTWNIIYNIMYMWNCMCHDIYIMRGKMFVLLVTSICSYHII